MVVPQHIHEYALTGADPHVWYCFLLTARGHGVRFRAEACVQLGHETLMTSAALLLENTTWCGAVCCTLDKLLCDWLPCWFDQVMDDVRSDHSSRKKNRKQEAKAAAQPAAKVNKKPAVDKKKKGKMHGWHPTMCFGVITLAVAPAFRLQSLLSWASAV